MNRGRVVTATIAVVSSIATVGCAFAAIWTSGDLSSHLGSTAALSLMLATPSGIAALVWDA